MNNTTIITEDSINLWINISIFLKWSVAFVGIGSIPVLFHTLYRLFTKYRQSQYFIFLSSIIVLDLVMLIAILINVIADSFPYTPGISGDVLCKYTAYIATATGSHSHWLWVCMYGQRFISVFYPMSRIGQQGFWRFILDSKKLLIWTGIFSFLSQVWLLFLIKDNYVDLPKQTAHYCGPDINVLSPSVYWFLEIFEVSTSYAIPFIITVILDISVLFKSNNTKLMLISLETITNKGFTSVEACSSYKIQSEGSIKATNLRRRRNIRRCLFIVTFQGLLNFPFYTLQFIVEIFHGDATTVDTNPIYLVTDAFFYLIYLSQFPLKAVFVHLLHLDWKHCQNTLFTPSSCENNSFGYRQLKLKKMSDP